MSKLDDIVKPVATLHPVFNNEMKKLDMKILMLEIFGDAMKEAKTIAEVGEIYRKKVSEL